MRKDPGKWGRTEDTDREAEKMGRVTCGNEVRSTSGNRKEGGRQQSPVGGNSDLLEEEKRGEEALQRQYR